MKIKVKIKGNNENWSVFQVGKQKGMPVVHFHGLASNSSEIMVFENLAIRNNLKIIGINRSDFNKTNKQFNRKIFFEDFQLILNELNIDSFCIQGHSAGGWYAIQLCELMNKRICKCSLISSLMPFNEISNFKISKLYFEMYFAKKHPEISKKILKEFIEIDFENEKHTNKKLNRLKFILNESDLKYLNMKNNPINRAITQTLKYNKDSVVNELIELTKEVKLNYSKINKIPINFYHGKLDKIIPIQIEKHFRNHLSDSVFYEFENDGHLSVLKHSDFILNKYIDLN